MMNKLAGGLGLVWLVVLVIVVVGWVNNLLNVIQHLMIDGAEITVLFVCQVLGIFAGPFGALLGLLFW